MNVDAQTESDGGVQRSRSRTVADAGFAVRGGLMALVSRLRETDPNVVLCWLFGAHVILKLALLPAATSTPLQGDERLYNTGARAIAGALRTVFGGGGLPVSDLQERVIAQGWFMPGMSLVLTPVYLVEPDAGLVTLRVYMGLLTTALLLLAVVLIARAAGRKYAAALLVFPGLVPMWVLFSYTYWGDLAAGLMLVVIIAILVRGWRRLQREATISLGSATVLGLVLAVTLYLRSSALPLVLLVLALVFVAVVCRTRGRKLQQPLVGWAVAVATFAALLLPWSVAASKTFDERVVTTTTVPISMAYAFGDRNELCFGPCRAGNPWYAMVEYSEKVAKRTGETELAVQRRMSEHAMREVTPQSYAAAVLGGFGRYLLHPSGYEAVFRVPADSKRLQPDPRGIGSWVVVGTTAIMYFVVLALAAAGILIVRRVPEIPQLVGLLAALLAAALMLQPFVHVSTARYWPVFAPMMALAAAGLLVWPDPARSNLWLRRLQMLAAAGWVVVFVALAVVAAV